MIVTESTPVGGLPRVRVDDVLAALVGARRRDREIARLDDGGDAVALERVLDADAPDVAPGERRRGGGCRRRR